MHLSRAIGHEMLAMHKNLLCIVNKKGVEESSLTASMKMLQKKLFFLLVLCAKLRYNYN